MQICISLVMIVTHETKENVLFSDIFAQTFGTESLNEIYYLSEIYLCTHFIWKELTLLIWGIGVCSFHI